MHQSPYCVTTRFSALGIQLMVVHLVRPNLFKCLVWKQISHVLMVWMCSVGFSRSNSFSITIIHLIINTSLSLQFIWIMRWFHGFKRWPVTILFKPVLMIYWTVSLVAKLYEEKYLSKSKPYQTNTSSRNHNTTYTSPLSRSLKSTSVLPLLLPNPNQL